MAPTHCTQGHALTQDNIYRNGKNQIICKTCRRNYNKSSRVRENRLRKKLEGNTPKAPKAKGQTRDSQLTPENYERMKTIKAAYDAFYDAIVQNCLPDAQTAEALRLARQAKYCALVGLYEPDDMPKEQPEC